MTLNVRKNKLMLLGMMYLLIFSICKLCHLSLRGGCERLFPDSSRRFSFLFSLRAVTFLSTPSNKAFLTQVQLWSNLNGVSGSLTDSSYNANPAASQAKPDSGKLSHSSLLNISGKVFM